MSRLCLSEVSNVEPAEQRTGLFLNDFMNSFPVPIIISDITTSKKAQNISVIDLFCVFSFHCIRCIVQSNDRLSGPYGHIILFKLLELLDQLHANQWPS